MTRKEFARIGDILPEILKSAGLDKKIRESGILTLWPEVVGEEVAQRTRAVKVDKGILYVNVDHGAWMQELHFMERDILRRLRARAPEVELHRIRFGTMK